MHSLLVQRARHEDGDGEVASATLSHNGLIMHDLIVLYYPLVVRNLLWGSWLHVQRAAAASC
jgi:hypothetical protein